ncbi:hypothetical protein [Persicobacter sp. CCB-QB2]|uniref:hypothetical protein n=1 Tax=Persicobacter sp. CCB-QB2 TaxID=1561025 RepID=UPI001C11FC8B|nr:hypothetical protein [Persicobacter sp. CCB-QB2]
MLLVVAGLFSCKSTEDELVGNGEITFNSALHSNHTTARVSGISAEVLPQVNTMEVIYEIGGTPTTLTFTMDSDLYPGAGTAFVTTDKVAFADGTSIEITEVKLYGDAAYDLISGTKDTNANDLLAITPLTGSNLANWTANLTPASGVDPAEFVTELPATFVVNANELLNIEFAAVDVRGNSATDFGYMNGIIHEGNIVRRNDFQISTTTLDATGKWVPVAGTLKIEDSVSGAVYFEEDETSSFYTNGFWKIGIPEGKTVTVSFDGGTIAKINYHGKADSPSTQPTVVTNPLTPGDNDVFDIICQ